MKTCFTYDRPWCRAACQAAMRARSSGSGCASAADSGARVKGSVADVSRWRASVVRSITVRESGSTCQSDCHHYLYPAHKEISKTHSSKRLDSTYDRKTQNIWMISNYCVLGSVGGG